MSSFEKTFSAVSAVASLPGAIFSEVFGVLGQLAAAVERVVVNGMTEHLDLRFSVFGRRVGISAEVSLLDKPEPKA
jgi:hypothetical protein